MKKIYTLLFYILLISNSNAQLLISDDFNYNTGSLTGIGGRVDASGGNWIGQNYGTLLKGPLCVTNGSLNYPTIRSLKPSHCIETTDLK